MRFIRVRHCLVCVYVAEDNLRALTSELSPIQMHRPYILREKRLAIYFRDSQLRRNMTFNFIVSKIYVDKRSRV